MTREHGTLLEGFCWVLVGGFVMFLIAKFAIEYR